MGGVYTIQIIYGCIRIEIGGVIISTVGCGVSGNKLAILVTYFI